MSLLLCIPPSLLKITGCFEPCFYSLNVFRTQWWSSASNCLWCTWGKISQTVFHVYFKETCPRMMSSPSSHSCLRKLVYLWPKGSFTARRRKRKCVACGWKVHPSEWARTHSCKLASYGSANPPRDERRLPLLSDLCVLLWRFIWWLAERGRSSLSSHTPSPMLIPRGPC